MVAAQALALERFLEDRGFAKKAALLSGPGAKLMRACDLPARHDSGAGESALDRLLTGGLSEGAFVELAARRSCGRFSLALSALAAATSSGEAAALVDLGDHLDPQVAEQAGVDLTRLLWVRPYRAKEAVAAAEMLLSAGFPLVVADFGLAPRGARYLPDAAWVRLARAAQARGSMLLIATPWRMSGVAAQAAVTASWACPIWQGGGLAPRLLAGLSSKLTLERDARARSGLVETLSLSVDGSVRDSRHPGKAVESRIEAHDSQDSVALHDGEMESISRREPPASEQDPLGALDVGRLHREHVVTDSQKRVESRLDGVAAVDGGVAVENFLEHFGVGHEAFPFGQAPLEHPLRARLVGVRSAHEVHRNVGVEEDHRAGLSR
jgi:hypothetical protein